MINATKLRNELLRFTGSENYYQHASLPDLVYTDGVHHFINYAGENGAYWLLDKVAMEFFPLLKVHPFLVIKITSENKTCKIIATDGDESVLKNDQLICTDIQQGEWQFYLSENVFFLPSEY